MKKTTRCLIWIICSLVCLSTIAVGFAVHTQPVSALPVAAADAPASVVRVKLSTGTAAETAFTVRGTYSAAGRMLAPGAYRIRNAGGKLELLDSAGAVLVSGTAPVMVTEHANPTAGAVNSITLKTSGVSRDFLGSMKFWLNGATINVVNHVFIEKYLYGVVAYEMSNYFPLEALKSQAVAARCYAVKRLEGKRDPTYDISDTSGDQVYRGYSAANANVIKAVDATAGQVLTNGGAIITAYYTASNGGQTDRTENVWSSALPYFKIRNDPFDTANPSSKQATVWFPVGTTADKQGDQPATAPLPPATVRYAQDDMDARLADFLRSFAMQHLHGLNAALPEGRKYVVTPDTVKIKAILDMKGFQTAYDPHCDHHAESTDGPAHTAANCPSIDFTGMNMAVLLKVSQQNAAAAGGVERRDLNWAFQFVVPDYLKSEEYPQWQVFTLGNNLRVYAAERKKDAAGIDSFALINRRYGHGVGLSQRGAQQRAASSDAAVNKHASILAFYFPNTVLATLSLKAPALPQPIPDDPRIIALVTRFYQLFMGREPDQAGQDYWVGGLMDGKLTGADVAASFGNSTEYKALKTTNASFLTTMYLAFFNREPDAGGVAHWTGLLEKGMTRYWVQSQFVNSKEFETVCADTGITRGSMTLTQPADLYPQLTQFVTRFYKITLERMPDETGLNHWVDGLAKGTLTGAGLARNMFLSTEFVGRALDNTAFVTALYHACLGREPDAPGLTYWTGELKRGTPRDTIMVRFINMPEYDQICTDSGIVRGAVQ